MTSSKSVIGGRAALGLALLFTAGLAYTVVVSARHGSVIDQAIADRSSARSLAVKQLPVDSLRLQMSELERMVQRCTQRVRASARLEGDVNHHYPVGSLRWNLDEAELTHSVLEAERECLGRQLADLVLVNAPAAQVLAQEAAALGYALPHAYAPVLAGDPVMGSQ